MIKLKRMKSVLLAACLALGLTLFASANAYAATAATYTAVSGDSLFKISQVYNTTVERLIQDNNLKSTSLNIGQVLKVPGNTYTVQKGDTLFLIAKRYNISFSALRRANNIYTDELNVGQVINLPVTEVVFAANTSPTSTVSASYSANDLDLLSRLICAEAVGEPYDAKVAVGAVVVNRVESGLFTDTISKVIYQNINGYYQFTPVANGWIDKPADADSIKAAKAALSGTDPTNGAIWYYDDTTTNQWILSKPVSIKIGSMVFAF